MIEIAQSIISARTSVPFVVVNTKVSPRAVHLAIELAARAQNEKSTAIACRLDLEVTLCLSRTSLCRVSG